MIRKKKSIRLKAMYRLPNAVLPYAKLENRVRTISLFSRSSKFHIIFSILVSFQDDDDVVEATEPNTIDLSTANIRRASLVPLAAKIRMNRPPTAPPGSIFSMNAKRWLFNFSCWISSFKVIQALTSRRLRVELHIRAYFCYDFSFAFTHKLNVIRFTFTRGDKSCKYKALITIKTQIVIVWEHALDGTQDI